MVYLLIRWNRSIHQRATVRAWPLSQPLLLKNRFVVQLHLARTRRHQQQNIPPPLVLFGDARVRSLWSNHWVMAVWRACQLCQRSVCHWQVYQMLNQTRYHLNKPASMMHLCLIQTAPLKSTVNAVRCKHTFKQSIRTFARSDIDQLTTRKQAHGAGRCVVPQCWT